jgi:PPM family protein phosphatase
MNTELPIGHTAVEAQVAGATDPGCVRRDNQDSFLVADLAMSFPEGLLLEPESEPGASSARPRIVGEAGVLLIVADGMGGAAAGALASRLAVGAIWESLSRRWQPEQNRSPAQFVGHLHAAIEQANARLQAEVTGRRELKGMGTTATVAVVLDGWLYLAQIGDSRAYVLRGGAATQLTRDQSYVQMLVDSGQMTVAEAERSSYASMILQAMGASEQVRAEVTYQELRHGDTVLLCSDGLTRLVRDDELAPLVDAASDLEEACGRLVSLARERGAPDNVTVVVLRAGGPGLQAPAPHDEVARRGFPAA